MQAIILAGGKGTRLAERLAGRPKPLVEVCGVPLLERQILSLKAHGAEEVVVLVNHAADQIHQFLADRSFGLRIRVIDDGEPKGTAGAVLACLPIMAPRSLIIYGDTLFDIDIPHMTAAHERAGADATLLLHPNDHPIDSHLVSLDPEGYVNGFHSPPHDKASNRRNLVNAALYVVERDALLRWQNTPVPSDFGTDLFPAMIAAGQRLFGYVSAEYIKDLGTPERLDKVERHLSSGLVSRSSRRMRQRAVFMDRDGTLNVPAGHICTPDALELIPGTPGAVRRLNDAGLRTVLVTNQPVIARGECDLATLEQIHGRLELLLSESGGYLDRIYFCPHHPHSGFAGEVSALKMLCDCRKPEIGMIEAGIEELNIDRYRSWMIGDSDADMIAAKRAGLLSIRVQTGVPAGPQQVADVEVADFSAAVHFVLEQYPRMLSAATACISEVRSGDAILVENAPPGMEAILRNELRANGCPSEKVSPDDSSTPETLGPDVVRILRSTSAPLSLASGRKVHRIGLSSSEEKFRSDY